MRPSVTFKRENSRLFALQRATIIFPMPLYSDAYAVVYRAINDIKSNPCYQRSKKNYYRARF
jgi:hypothetical protein